MHLHGFTFQIVATDGNPLKSPLDASTVLLGASQTADLTFTANQPGTWMLHCHIMDHTVNPSPNAEGNAAHESDMGGLVTFIKVVPGTGVTEQVVPAQKLLHL